jgi:hypothetical protein
MHNIKEYLSYDPLTGVLTWFKSPANNIKAGSTAGAKLKHCIHISYKGKHYKAHRLIWLIVYGVMPKCNIDHINENPYDNRLCNLRLDIGRENEQNKSNPNTNNKSGFRGVHWYKAGNSWRAFIKIKGKQLYLGSYDTPEEAHAAYLCAKKEHHPFWVGKEAA